MQEEEDEGHRGPAPLADPLLLSQPLPFHICSSQ